MIRDALEVFSVPALRGQWCDVEWGVAVGRATEPDLYVCVAWAKPMVSNMARAEIERRERMEAE